MIFDYWFNLFILNRFRVNFRFNLDLNNFFGNKDRIMSSDTSKTKVFLKDHLKCKNPISQFKAWFNEARENERIKHPGAFCLATSSRDGFPTARFVVMTSYGKEGFKFFTDYNSRKAIEIDENPIVAGSFYWEALNRAVRIEGPIEKVSEEESKSFFESRPLAGQIAVWGSHQSTPIENKEQMKITICEMEKKYANKSKEIPKPPYWGGYAIHPTSFEFWQGYENCFADRIRFRRPKCEETPDGRILYEGEDGWVYERLSP